MDRRTGAGAAFFSFQEQNQVVVPCAIWKRGKKRRGGGWWIDRVAEGSKVTSGFKITVTIKHSYDTKSKRRANST